MQQDVRSSTLSIGSVLWERLPSSAVSVIIWTDGKIVDNNGFGRGASGPESSMENQT